MPEQALVGIPLGFGIVVKINLLSFHVSSDVLLTEIKSNHLCCITMQSALGWDHQEQLSKHESQTDAAKGFGGKYGVQKESQDKVSITVDTSQCHITYM